MNNVGVFVFGPFVLDPVKRVLLRSNVLVPLHPPVFEILLELASSAGEVVTKRRLMDRVWPHTFVEESNLVQDIAQLRRALEGIPTARGNERYIVTVPRKGYRFVGEVALLSTTAASGKAPIGIDQARSDQKPGNRRTNALGKEQLRGEVHFPEVATPGPAPFTECLSPRERVVLQMVIAGRTSREVASQLGIKRKTVECHRGRICAKLGLRGSHSLVRFVLEHRSPHSHLTDNGGAKIDCSNQGSENP